MMGFAAVAFAGHLTPDGSVSSSRKLVRAELALHSLIEKSVGKGIYPALKRFMNDNRERGRDCLCPTL